MMHEIMLFILFDLCFYQANEDVVQAVEIFKSQDQKWKWLLKHIVEFMSGRVQRKSII